MKARLFLAFTVLFAGLLSSCQQAFVDTQARENGAGVTAEFSPPSYSPSDVAFPSGTLAPTSTDGGGYASDVVSALAGISFIPTATQPPTSTGLPGYTTNFGSSVKTVDSGTATNSSAATVGTYVRTVEDYEEMSTEFYNSIASDNRLYRKAIHRVQVTEYSITVNLNDKGTTMSGRMTYRERSEWYKDVTMLGGVRTDLQYGIAELSTGFAIAENNANGVGSKVIGNYYMSYPYALSGSAEGSYPVDYNVAVYNKTSGVPVYSNSLSNSEYFYDASDNP